MTVPTTPKAPAVEEASARDPVQASTAEDGKNAELERFGALQQAFPGEAECVGTQFAAGASVAEAKAAFADVLKERLAASQVKIDELTKIQSHGNSSSGFKGKADPGAAPVTAGAAPAEQDGEDFISVARALAEEKGINKQQAMSRLARQRPELHRAFVSKAREEAGRRAQRVS